MYDVIILGGGVCGCSIFYTLSRYSLRVLLLEKENDLALGATKANSGIVHAGFDPYPGSLMAQLNTEGCSMMPALCKELDVPYRNTGSLVLAFGPEEEKTLEKLRLQGEANGVPNLRILNKKEVLESEPALSPHITAALYAPTAGIVSPWELALAQAEAAVLNGGEVLLEAEVQNIVHEQGRFIVQSSQGEHHARFLVNAAGLASTALTAFFEPPTYRVQPSRGQYFLLDKSQGELTKQVIFRCPGPTGKGVLVAPTTHGNLIVGPNSEAASSPATTAEGLECVRNEAARLMPSIDFRQSIRNFSGIRARSSQPDFILRASTETPGYFELGGIKSPGLTAAPAIAKRIAAMLEQAGLVLQPKAKLLQRPPVPRFGLLRAEEKNALIQHNPSYGRMVCRCETVTEGEILCAIHSPVPPRSLDGIKRRCQAGMGRCQGGFCGPRVLEILARETGQRPQDIPLDRVGMTILLGPTKVKTTKQEAEQ